ncbi:hypothetical protein CWI70_11640 [Pseudidiomarina homiensis]|uniref:Uncharacterized protein n=1 Tax=Pseudidiomarina homiensis TaxID=364198 RepID=A0A432XUV4_9GAMM|nr:hypothetical protein CWI70_11640 [Pseudidiomarina homiensis]
MTESKKEAILEQFKHFPKLLICLDVCSRSGSVIFGENPPELSMSLLAELRAEGKIERKFREVHGIHWCEVTPKSGRRP